MTSVASAQAERVRVRIRVRGVVQGVGYRPFVHRAAAEWALAGHVGNDTDGVFVEVEGPPAAVAAFEARLRSAAPPLARVDAVESVPMALVGEADFRIVESRSDSAVRTFVAPDAALCDDCLRELFDPGDRRYRYPFITCTNCGPRFTITQRLPYDRPNTTMASFVLCDACAGQYHDPLDRRFHAQPLACADCGPRLWLETDAAAVGGAAAGVAGVAGVAGSAGIAGVPGVAGSAGIAVGASAGVPRASAGRRRVEGTDAALAEAQESLARGEVVAIKGLGGYHIACDARSDEAVARLRRRKGRADKPFAVMARDLDVARGLALIDADEARLMLTPQHPIVLLAVRADSPLSPLVAPDNPMIGIMLPYTPLHHLLFNAVPVPGDASGVGRAPDVLVMTSGNITDEPICYQDDDARQRLGRLADSWLIHDRPIHVPCDDSVVRMVDGEELPIRRSRGYAPLPLRLPVEVPPMLAVGGELKNTFCLASGHDAWMSQHIGDMGSPETLAAFERSTGQFRDIYQITPERLAADMHPGYHTRNWAEDHAGDAAESPGPALSLSLVQHHHAHVAAVMAEHGVPATEQVLGFAFDGTGYGTDGAIWGGEALLATYSGFTRVAHLGYVPLPGGDATIKRPYRAALAHLWAAGIDWTDDLAPVQATDEAELRALRGQIERDVFCVPTSSMGRLFDAVSSLLGVRHRVSYEAQAAIELETQAEAHMDSARTYRFGRDGVVIDAAPVLRAIIDDLRAGVAQGEVAAGFHLAVATLVGELATDIAGPIGVRRTALSGGVFQNVLLLRLTRAELRARGFEVLTHRIVPPNDGGLALGQLVVAAATLSQGVGPETEVVERRSPETTRSRRQTDRMPLN
jgi:hydrogenase maturation protein HypF